MGRLSDFGAGDHLVVVVGQPNGNLDEIKSNAPKLRPLPMPTAAAVGHDSHPRHVGRLIAGAAAEWVEAPWLRGMLQI